MGLVQGVFGNRLLYYYYWDGLVGVFLWVGVFLGCAVRVFYLGINLEWEMVNNSVYELYRAHGVYSKYYNTQINNEISQTNPKTNQQKNKTPPRTS